MMCPCCGKENPDEITVCPVCEYEFTAEDYASCNISREEQHRRLAISYIYIIATIIGLAIAFGIFGLWIRNMSLAG